MIVILDMDVDSGSVIEIPLVVLIALVYNVVIVVLVAN